MVVSIDLLADFWPLDGHYTDLFRLLDECASLLAVSTTMEHYGRVNSRINTLGLMLVIRHFVAVGT